MTGEVVQTHRLSRYPSLVFLVDETMPPNTCRVDKNGIGRCNSATWERIKTMAATLASSSPPIPAVEIDGGRRKEDETDSHPHANVVGE